MGACRLSLSVFGKRMSSRDPIIVVSVTGGVSNGLHTLLSVFYALLLPLRSSSHRVSTSHTNASSPPVSNRPVMHMYLAGAAREGEARRNNRSAFGQLCRTPRHRRFSKYKSHDILFMRLPMSRFVVFPFEFARSAMSGFMICVSRPWRFPLRYAMHAVCCASIL